MGSGPAFPASRTPPGTGSSRPPAPTGAFAPWEIVGGRTPSWRSGRTWRNPAPFGAQTHLWRLPAYHAAPIAVRSSGSIPGAWAPSTNVSMSRSANAATIRATGRTSAVGLVTWLRMAIRVRSVTASSIASTTCVLVPNRERDPGHHDAGARFFGDVPGDVENRVVLVVVGQDLVAQAEAERAQDRVRRAGRVRHEREVVRIGPEELAEDGARLGEEARQVARQELDRPGLEPVAPLALRLQDRPRTRAERAVVEEGDRRIERPERGEGRRHARIMPGTLGPWVPSTRWSRSSSC